MPFFGWAVRGRSFQSQSSATETPARLAIFWSVSPFRTRMRFSTTAGATGSAAICGARSAAEPAGTRTSYAGTPCGVARVLSSLLRSWSSGSVEWVSVGHAREIDTLPDRHRVPGERRIGHDVEAEARRVLRDERRRENEGDVVARLAPETAARRELPEIARARALEALQDATLARVVRGHREMPVAEHLVQVAEIGRGGARGLDGIAPLVERARSA